MIPADPVSWAIKAFRDPRASAYALYGDYAAGNQSSSVALSSASGPLGNLLVAMTYNRCAPVVDAIADRLNISGFRDATGKAEADAVIDLWQENRMDKREGEVNQEALTSGDGYVIVWPDAATSVPTIWPQDAAAMRVFYDDERPGLITLATKLWRGSDDYIRLNVYLPDRLEKYITKNKYRTGIPQGEAAFEVYQPDGDMTWPLRYDWFRDTEPSVPVFHFGNNARTGRYGTSELKAVVPLQDALNKSVTDLIKGSELGGHPQKWAKGVDQATVNDAVVVGMDRVLASSHADAAFGNFDATNLTQLVAVVNQFDLMISRTARIPAHYLALSGDFPSGEALKTAEAPFVRKITDRQVAFGNVWEDCMVLAMRMQNIELSYRLEAVYEPAEPRSDRERAELAVLYKQAGWPLPAILRELGMSQAEIDVILGEQADAVERARAAFDAGEDDLVDDGDTEAA